MIASWPSRCVGGLLCCWRSSPAARWPMPRLERDRCVFRPPRGDKLECYTLVVPENRAKPKGPEVRLKVAVLKAKRPLAADPVIYLAGGPGDSPLVASTAGADPLAEGDWWNDTAVVRRRRDVIIISQRGAGGSTPNLDCFEPRTSRAGARQAPRRDRAAGARDPAALPRRLRPAQDRSRDVRDAGAGRRRRRPREGDAAAQGQSLRHLLRHALGARGDAPPSRHRALRRARRRLPAADQRRAERARDRAHRVRAALRRMRRRTSSAASAIPISPPTSRRCSTRGRSQAARDHAGARGRTAAGEARRRQAAAGAAAHDAAGRGGARARGGDRR